MDPATLMLFSIGANMLGSFIQARAQKQAAEANAQTLEQNAGISDQAAGDALLRGQLLEGRVKLQGTQVQSKQKATLAASGVDTQSGSAVDVQASTGGLSALDALIVRSNAAREAWGYTTQGKQFRRQAQVARATGQAQATGSILGGVTGSARAGLPFLTVSGQGSGDYLSASPLGGATGT